jgi:hypothetical protein
MMAGEEPMRSIAIACVIASVPLLVGRTAAAQDAPGAETAEAPAPAAVTSAPAQPPPPAPAAPPQAFAPPPPEPSRSPLIIVPFVGVHSFQNDTAKNLDAGLRLGGIVGGRVSDVLSLGGEAVLDVVNPNGVPSGVDVTALQFHIAFSPLLHARSGGAELVVGPKLGFFLLSEDVSGGGVSASESIHGWLFGGNIGAFGAVSDTMSVGGLVSFDFEKATEACGSAAGQPEMCTSSGLDNTAKVLGVAAAMIF